jgi:hypothetical protein
MTTMQIIKLENRKTIKNQILQEVNTLEDLLGLHLPTSEIQVLHSESEQYLLNKEVLHNLLQRIKYLIREAS